MNLDRNKIFIWAIWLCSVIFFMYEFLVRILPSVMVPQLMATFHVEAAALGNLSAYYFYIYAPMQFPVGVLMDRYGARRLLAIAIFCCGVGTIFFGIAQTLALAEFSRVLMGFGSAFAFVAMIYIAAHGLPHRHLSLFIGIGNSAGMLGAVFGEGPLTIAIEKYGWRSVSIGAGIFGLILSALVFILFFFARTKDKKSPTRADTFAVVFKNLKRVCTNIQTWVIAGVATGLYATTTAFAGLWCIPFLQTVHGFSKEEAGFASSMIFVGWIVGGPLIGFVSTHLGRIKSVMMICALGGLICLSPVIYSPAMNTITVFTLLFFTGFFSSAELLGFRYAIEINPLFARGSSLAFTNFAIMLAGAFLQPLVGYLLEANVESIKIHHVPVYTTSDYLYALSVFPLSFFIAFLLSFFLKSQPVQKNENPSKRT